MLLNPGIISISIFFLSSSKVWARRRHLPLHRDPVQQQQHGPPAGRPRRDPGLPAAQIISQPREEEPDPRTVAPRRPRGTKEIHLRGPLGAGGPAPPHRSSTLCFAADMGGVRGEAEHTMTFMIEGRDARFPPAPLPPCSRLSDTVIKDHVQDPL